MAGPLDITFPPDGDPGGDAADATANAAIGATTDAAVVTDANGTISGKLRGLIKMFADVWDSTNHFFKTSFVTLLYGEDSVNNVIRTEQQFTYIRVTADGQAKAGAGFLHSISIAGITATPTAGLLTIYDSLTETGTVIYSEWVFATDVGHTVLIDTAFATGLYIGFDATLANVQVTATIR